MGKPKVSNLQVVCEILPELQLISKTIVVTSSGRHGSFHAWTLWYHISAELLSLSRLLPPTQVPSPDLQGYPKPDLATLSKFIVLSSDLGLGNRDSLPN